MKKTIKLTAAALAAVTAMSCASFGAYADRIKKVDGLSYLYSDSGESKGLYTGWSRSSKGKRYYKKGVMYKDRYIKTKKGKRYYADWNGYIVTGWYRMNGKWHWFGKDGVEAVGDITVGGATYSFSPDGEWDGLGGLDISMAKAAVEKKMPKEIYGGIYNDEGIITVRATDVDAARKTIDELYPESIGIIVRSCRFTYKYLSEVQQKIMDNYERFDVAAVINLKENIITLAGDDRSEEFRKYLKDNGFDYCVATTDDIDEDD